MEKAILRCDTCCKSYAGKDSLWHHTKSAHPLSKEQVYCKVCGKSFSETAKLNYHLLVHSEERKFVCKICCKAFKQRTNLITHFENHFGLKKVFCEICKKVFANMSNLRRHKKSLHFLLDYMACPLCSKTFSSDVLLKNHFDRMHTTVNLQTFKCHTCGRLYKSKDNLRVHVKKHLGKSFSL